MFKKNIRRRNSSILFTSVVVGMNTPQTLRTRKNVIYFWSFDLKFAIVHELRIYEDLHKILWLRSFRRGSFVKLLTRRTYARAVALRISNIRTRLTVHHIFINTTIMRSTIVSHVIIKHHNGSQCPKMAHSNYGQIVRVRAKAFNSYAALVDIVRTRVALAAYYTVYAKTNEA